MAAPNLGTIFFHTENISFELEHLPEITDWIKDSIKIENKLLKNINYIFCSDEYLYNINMEYLQHNTYTDIITFPYSYEPIESDIFISIDRIKDNAKELNVSFLDELHRVIIHGALHLIGFDDKSEAAQVLMTQKENEYLAKRTF